MSLTDFSPEARIYRVNAAIDALTAAQFIRVVQTRLSGIAPDDCELSAPLIELGCALCREGARLAVIQETQK